MTEPPRIKVCCITSPAEAALAVAAGAHALGLVSEMPSGPGVIDEAEIAAIAADVSPSVETFLLTALTEADAIAEQHARCGTTTLQLVDHVPLPELRRLRRSAAGARLVQAIHVVDESSVHEAMAAAPLVDALLLDSGNPKAAVPELGGTGRVHDWSMSRRIRASVAVPVYLAGGLHAANVSEALRAVRPWGLDLCSGVRRDGALDATLLDAFFAGARTAVGA